MFSFSVSIATCTDNCLLTRSCLESKLKIETTFGCIHRRSPKEIRVHGEVMQICNDIAVWGNYLDLIRNCHHEVGDNMRCRG